MATVTFSGLASGIDADGLIKATSDATRSQRVEPLEKKVTDLTATNNAFSELKTKLATLQTNARKFATISGGGLVKQGTSSDETKVSASASSSAINATYTVTVATLAKNGTISLSPSAGTYTSETATISAGTEQIITIGTGTGAETINIGINAGVTKISDFVTEFNNESTKARASLVNVGTASSPDYRIVINSNKTGTIDGSITVDTNAAGFSAPTSSAATNATFTIAGIGSITRQTNSVSDVITGVTLDLRSAGTSTISINDDISASTSVVEELVDSWNEIVNYVKQNNTITREEDGESVTNTFGAFATSRVDDNLLTTLRSALSGTVYGSGSEIRIFPDLGITTERDGTLKFDTKVFKDAMNNEPISANAILTEFADTVSTTGGTIDQYIRFSGLIDSTVTSNKTQITNSNTRISEIEKQILRTEESLRARFARLESTVSRLQAQQGSLNSALAGL
jgi:flagellar hook-associated protein 2